MSNEKKNTNKNIQEISSTLFIKKPKNYLNKLKDTRETSRGQARDEEDDNIGDDNIIEPPYNLEALSELVGMSAELPQNIEAMKQNCEGYGYNLISTVEEEDKDRYKTAIKEEANRVNDFFEYSSYQISFTKTRKNLRGDLESIGNAYMEILRNEKGLIDGFEWIKAIDMRLTELDLEYTDIEFLKYDSSTKTYRVTKQKRRFRRYVQVINENKIFFKEFGDPRIINARDGKVVGEEEYKTSKENGTTIIPATEMFHFSLINSQSVYGLPRWIGATAAIVGSRAMEETNVSWFHNKAIPPVAFLVSGGKLTKGAVKRIKEYMVAQTKGLENYHNALVVDAIGSGTPGQLEKNNVKIDIKELQQLKEGIFIEYDKENRKKIRSSFRLPPIFVGATDDYTQATAKESKEVAEEQVFQPERSDFDFFINRNIFPALDVKYHKFQTKSVPINNRKDETDVTKIQSESGLSYLESRKKLNAINEIQVDEINSDKAYMNLPQAVALELLKTGAISLNDTMQDLENGLIEGVNLDNTDEADAEIVEQDDKDKSKTPVAIMGLSKVSVKTIKELQALVKLTRQK